MDNKTRQFRGLVVTSHKVDAEDLIWWENEFRRILTENKKYLNYFLIERTHSELRVQYSWKEDLCGAEKHEFTIRTGRDWSDEDCLNAYRKADIARHRWEVLEAKAQGRIVATISVSTYPESGDGINPYYRY